VTVAPNATARTGAAPRDEPRAAQPRQLIVTVYGLYARAEGGWMSVAALISLLADLGVDEPAVRSSISRLKRREILHARRRAGAAGYELSPTAQAILAEGDHRIFRKERARLADGWLLAVFSVPESERSKRHVLRSQLARLGFGTAAPGVWIAPAYLHEATADMLARLGLSGYADLFRADHLAARGLAGGDLAQKVRQWWDLEQTERLARDFVTAWEPVLRDWARRRAEAHGRAAFADYVRVLTDWRRLPYLDPGLPAELLPAGWAGAQAAEVFFTLQSRLADAAAAHVASTQARGPAAG
jgi:phenylacetic acid degradation operon negative regulatory protein